ncbi:MAG: DUF1877 family protein [bacterium]
MVWLGRERELEERYNSEEMTELSIYPQIWDNPHDEQDDLDFLLKYFVRLKPFVAEAVGRKMGLFTYLN